MGRMLIDEDHPPLSGKHKVGPCDLTKISEIGKAILRFRLPLYRLKFPNRRLRCDRCRLK